MWRAVIYIYIYIYTHTYVYTYIWIMIMCIIMLLLCLLSLLVSLVLSTLLWILLLSLCLCVDCYRHLCVCIYIYIITPKTSVIPVPAKEESPYAIFCPAIRQQKLLSAPRFGAPKAHCPMRPLLRSSLLLQTLVRVPEKGEVLLRGVGTLQYVSPPNASVQWQPEGFDNLHQQVRNRIPRSTSHLYDYHSYCCYNCQHYLSLLLLFNYYKL